MATVLITDDALFMRSMLQDILQAAGHRVIGEAEDGAQAVKLYGVLKPDVVTLDVVMPGKSGPEVVRELLALDRNARIVMVSSISQIEVVEEALRLGAKAYITKPFDPERVRETVAKALVL